MKKSNGKSNDKIPLFLSSASGSANEAESSIISNEIKFYFIKSQMIEHCALRT